MLIRQLSFSVHPTFSFRLSYCEIRSVGVYCGKTNTRLNDEDQESFYIDRQNPIISSRELS